jgi:hypothetical protein
VVFIYLTFTFDSLILKTEESSNFRGAVSPARTLVASATHRLGETR